MAKMQIADHTAIEEELWADMEAGRPLLGTVELARATGILPATLQGYLNRHIVARIRIGYRFFSTKAAVIESLKANDRAEAKHQANPYFPKGDWDTRQANARAKLEKMGITQEKLDRFKNKLKK